MGRTIMHEYQNCWEHTNCGRGPNGHNVSIRGICPAARETRLHGVHGGINGGRACWVVAGTFCKGRVQGVFAEKYQTCQECDFYRKVQRENFRNFQVSFTLLKRLRENG